MSACAPLTELAALGVAPALRAVDCLANETAAAAFGRLFGIQGGHGGALLPALTILLTLYIAFFAFSLITGRSRIGVSALTPRMLTLGMVLTFATSWIAYQGVVWTLATGAPDQIAGTLLGARGSATQIFADRIDIIFAAIAEAASGGARAAQGQGGQASGSFTPANLTWLAALLLLLGTVGVLVTARIALAVLLAVGPVFVVMALFPATRGLTAGWLRGLLLMALAPLFVVLGGGLVIELLVPVVARLRNEMGVDGRAALALFTIAAVHLALMAISLKVAGAMVAGWSVFGLDRGESGRGDAAATPQAAPGAIVAAGFAPAPTAPLAARRTIAPIAVPPTVEPAASLAAPARADPVRTLVTHLPGAPLAAAAPRLRAQGVGSRFRAPASRPREFAR